jgi:hypothetical protein
MRTRLLAAIVVGAASSLLSCASPESFFGKDPIIDMTGVDPQDYQTDLAECRAYADQVQTGRQVVTGAATGAVVGGAVGAIGGNSSTAARTAGIGGVMGTVNGTSSAISERRVVLRNCLLGRGYRVLN